MGYKWTCKNCERAKKLSVYEGETSRSGRLRGKEHLKDLEKKREKSVLYKHKLLEHPNEEEVDFKMEVTGVFKDALTRQANEAVRISSRGTTETMNSKGQFNHPPMARIVVDKR